MRKLSGKVLMDEEDAFAGQTDVPVRERDASCAPFHPPSVPSIIWSGPPASGSIPAAVLLLIRTDQGHNVPCPLPPKLFGTSAGRRDPSTYARLGA